MPRKFLTAEWRSLVMLNYEVDPNLMLPLVPRGTEIDFFQGKTYLSLVGFWFVKTRLMGFAIPFHQQFEEINLRFYVRRKDVEGWRRGVVFVKEIVPKWAVAKVAKWVYNENYVYCRMFSRVELPTTTIHGHVEYGWEENKQKQRLWAEIQGEPAPLVPGSEAEFITEHYWGYTAQRDGGTLEYRVEHPPWKVWTASSAHAEIDISQCYGHQFTAPLSLPPTSAFVAEGSPIAVYQGTKIA